MTRIHLLACILCAFCLDLYAQEPIAKTLEEALVLIKQRHYQQMMDVLGPVLKSSALRTEDRGRALMLIATAYQAEGRFSESHRALDQSLTLLRGYPQYARDYADGLTSLSVLYRDTGDADAMKQTAMKALHLYEQANDHEGLADIYVVLAQYSVNWRKVADARHYVGLAAGEFTQFGTLADRNRIAMTDLQAGIALLEGHAELAVIDYRQSLDLRIQFNGSEHPDTGWGYMLLGKADLQAGDVRSALAEMKQGLAILAQTNGIESMAYLGSEISYTDALAADGQRSEAKRIKADATQALSKVYREQCAACQINTLALR
jgi:hypothetical protein